MVSKYEDGIVPCQPEYFDKLSINCAEECEWEIVGAYGHAPLQHVILLCNDRLHS